MEFADNRLDLVCIRSIGFELDPIVVALPSIRLFFCFDNFPEAAMVTADGFIVLSIFGRFSIVERIFGIVFDNWFYSQTQIKTGIPLIEHFFQAQRA